MSEKTNIDYEQKYNEAVLRADEAVQKGCLDKDMFDIIFPELRESDDERIRKNCIHFLELQKQHHAATFEIEECIDWLEKQKENPKTADSIPEDCASSAKCEDRWHKVQDSLPDNGRLVLANDCLGNTLLARYDGECNWEVSVYDNDDYYCHNTITKWCDIPSETSKESLHIPESCKENADSFTGSSESDKIAAAYQLGRSDEKKEQKDFRKLYEDIAKSEWFKKAYEGKSLGELASSASWKDDEQKPCGCVNVESEYDKGWRDGHKAGLKDAEMQKPVEWSEEDEEMLKCVIMDVESAKTNYLKSTTPAVRQGAILADEELAWLKALRPQPKPDCDGCAKHLEGYISGRSDAENKLLEKYGIAETPEDELHMKARWKPSEEQMIALLNIEGDLRAFQYNDKAKIIAELYEQLKRL